MMYIKKADQILKHKDLINCTHFYSCILLSKLNELLLSFCTVHNNKFKTTEVYPYFSCMTIKDNLNHKTYAIIELKNCSIRLSSLQ